MITKLTVKNFKKLDISLDLSSAVVFVGPNNSGKTSALQAITLWDLGLRRWIEARKTSKAKERLGVTINRRDLFAVPVPSAKQLWWNLHTYEKSQESGKQKKVNIEVRVEGFTKGRNWKFGFEFDYTNAESFYCRLLSDSNPEKESEIVLDERIGFLPPMSGLSSREDKLEWGSINARIGEGRTAEVMRNLCWQIYSEKPDKWTELAALLKKLFGVEIQAPINAAGILSMSYREDGNELDICNAGRGFQQTLLIFSYVYAGHNSVLLLDEPDAHLEIIRQKEIFNLLSDIVKKEHSQLIVATHSEAVLNEAIDKDQVVAFLGKPHTIPTSKRSQLLKSLTQFGFEQYLLAEQKKWVLYVEGATDVAILKAFAGVLNHPVKEYLNEPFVWYMGNQMSKASEHFYALQEAVPGLKGLAISDYDANAPIGNERGLEKIVWERKEIENYLPLPEILNDYIAHEMSGDGESLPLFHNNDVMSQLIQGRIPPVALDDKNDSWWIKTKMSDDFLDIVFGEYFKRMGMPMLMTKGSYHLLLQFAKPEQIHKEVKEKLDKILALAQPVR